MCHRLMRREGVSEISTSLRSGVKQMSALLLWKQISLKSAIFKRFFISSVC
jgi:hypothetical protein